MFPAPSTIALLSALAFGARAQDDASTQEPFPSSTALAEAVSPEGLAKLGSLVQNLVDDEEIVGAELLVIRHGRSVLHEAYGWKDREAKAPMKKGSLFCVRSMTKPVIGAAILMLIEEGRLAFDDPVSKYLPAFDYRRSADIRA
jgi:CubicO group peptidase (beta-lactamase class C family)